VALGPRSGRRIVKVGDVVELEDLAVPSGPRCATISGFSLHANVCIPAHDRMRLERLLRYAGRPPVATERLSRLPDGRLLYRLKRRWRDGTSHVIFEPMELIAKLAALVPPPLQPGSLLRHTCCLGRLEAADHSGTGVERFTLAPRLPGRKATVFGYRRFTGQRLIQGSELFLGRAYETGFFN
jgi:hypothetical protein